MKKEIVLQGRKVSYELQYKPVRRMNLRIKPDGSIFVSVSPRVPKAAVEDFLRSKETWILKALSNVNTNAPTPYFTEEALRQTVNTLCRQAYPYFEQMGVAYPKIKFRRMVSRWGSCHCAKGILTFSTHLMYAPPECVHYVVLHEFTHFLQANHSARYYEELEKVCPDWKILRKRLKEIRIPLLKEEASET